MDIQCPPPDYASPYQISLCIQKETQGKLDLDPYQYNWTVEPTPPPNENVAESIDTLVQVLLILGIGLIIYFSLYILVMTYMAHERKHRGKRRYN